MYYGFLKFLILSLEIIMMTGTHACRIEWCHVSQVFSVSICFVFNLLHSSANQQLFEKSFVIKVTTMKNTDDFFLPSRAKHKIDTFHGQQR